MAYDEQKASSTYDCTRKAILEESKMRAAQIVTEAEKPSCFGSVEDVCGLSGSAAARVEKVVSRLCGYPPPTPAETGSIQGDANGLFEATDRLAREIRANLERIFAAIDRLEKHLP